MLLRGIWYRAGRATVVALLAAMAVAAAVLAPGFSRAAQQSVLTDALATVPAAATGLTVTATGTAIAAPTAHEPLPTGRDLVDAAVADQPGLARAFAGPIGGWDTDTVVSGGSEPVAARLAYRDRLCPHLVITGGCPEQAGEVLISARTAEDYQLAQGDVLTARLVDQRRDLVVVGIYVPVDPASAYWGRTVYFTHGGFDPASGAPRVDAVFTADPADVQADPAAVVTAELTYPLRPDGVRLDDLPGLRAALADLPGAVRAADQELVTALPAVLDDVAGDLAAIGQSAPVLAVPLLVLGWFVLFLLVAAVTEDRGREIALAKLRGYPAGRTVRFGLGEMLLLIVAAAPVGFVAGLGAVELVARWALAEGTHLELRWPLFGSAAVALAAAGLAALVAGRATLGREALALLRQVPQRVGWRAGLAEGAVVALAAASLLVAVGDPAAPLALLAPALLAVVAGVATARLVRLLVAVRLRRARHTGRLPALLAAAQLTRRPAGRQVIMVVTVAVALLSFAAVSWDVAGQARQDHAVDMLGADRVYTVRADHPAALLEAVAAAAPAGTAMAVVRASERYAGEQVELLAVDAPRLPQVVTWRDSHRPGQGGPTGLAGLAAVLRPAEPASLWINDRLEVIAQVSGLGEQPVRLSALVSAPGGPPRAVQLGTLTKRSHRYAAPVSECADGCRLLGLGLGRTGVAGPFTATVEVQSIRSGGAELATRFDDPSAWRVAPTVPVTRGPGLRVAVNGDHPDDVLLTYQDTPSAVPVVLAGAAPADDPAGAEFRFVGLAERPEPFTVAARVERLPGAGGRGLLLDLRYAVASAERSVALSDHAGLRYEVWAGAQAPADLRQRLAAQGVTVLTSDSIAGTVDELSRRAPALAQWLGLLAAAVAVALAVGVVALSTRLQLPARRQDLAALRVAGVPDRLLRRAVQREYATLLGWPLLVGAAVGVAAAALLLPGMPLVVTGAVGELPGWRISLRAVPAAAVVTISGLSLAALAATRLPAERGTGGSGGAR